MFFTFHELTKTNTNLENIPAAMEHVQNLCILADFLNDIREEFKEPIVVNSGFRTPVVNHKIGGVPNSLHTKGRAADIRPNYYPANDYKFRLYALYDLLNNNVEDLSELILHDTYIHVAI